MGTERDLSTYSYWDARQMAEAESRAAGWFWGVSGFLAGGLVCLILFAEGRVALKEHPIVRANGYADACMAGNVNACRLFESERSR